MSDKQPFEKAMTISKKQVMLNNFVGGIFWAIGTTVGLALIVGILALLGKYVNFIPFIGNFIADIVKFVQVKT